MKNKINIAVQKLTEYSLYGFALCSFWGWSLMQIFFAFALLGFLVLLVTGGFKTISCYKYNLFDIAFVLMIIGSFISCFLGIDPMKSLGQHAFIKTAGWMFMYIVVRLSFRSKKQFTRTVWLLIWSALIGSLYAVIRGIIRGEDRFGGGLGHPIHLGIGMDFAIAIICVLILYALTKEGKKLFMSPGKWILLIISLICCFAALIGSHSSSGLVSLFVLVLFVAFFVREWIAYVLVATVVAIFITGIFIIPSSKLGLTISKITDMKHQSVHERFCMWKSAVNIIKDHPLGIGVDNMGTIYEKYMLPEAVEREPKAHVHNNFLQLAAERGLPVLGLFIFFIIAFYVVFLNEFKNIPDGFLKHIFIGIGAVFTVLICTGFFEYSWGASQAMLNFWFLTGMGMAVVSNNHSGLLYDGNNIGKGEIVEK